MLMFGSFITSGALPAVGSAMSAPVVGAVLGLALLVLVLILVGMADRAERPVRTPEPEQLSRGFAHPLGHGRSA